MPTSKVRAGNSAANRSTPGARRHRRRHRHDLRVLARLLDQALPEHLGIGRRVRLRLGLRPGRDIELHHPVVLVLGRLRRRVALALLGDDVDQHRAVLGVAHVLQHRQQVGEVMPVDRPDVIEPELLEQGASGPEPAGELLGARRALFEHLGQVGRQLLGDLAQRAIGAPRQQPRQVGRHRADRRRNRHVVVVEHHDQPRVHRPRIVHRLVGHAGRHRPVADHAHHIVRLALEVARHRHPQPRRDRGRGMRRPERVVGAFRPLGEAR